MADSAPALRNIIHDDRQLFTIMHALRCLQENIAIRAEDSCCSETGCDHFADVSKLNHDEIEELIERLWTIPPCRSRRS